MRLPWTVSVAAVLGLFVAAGSSLLAAADTPPASAAAGLLVRINDASPIAISAVDLAALPHHTVAFNNHGSSADYDGVLISDVLRKAGLDLSKGLHGKQLASYLTAIGSDGYEVVFALSDFDPSIVESGIMIVDKENGTALPEKEGPLRVIAPHDKKAVRSVRMLQEIDIVELRK